MDNESVPEQTQDEAVVIEEEPKIEEEVIEAAPTEEVLEEEPIQEEKPDPTVAKVQALKQIFAAVKSLSTEAANNPKLMNYMKALCDDAIAILETWHSEDPAHQALLDIAQTCEAAVNAPHLLSVNHV